MDTQQSPLTPTGEIRHITLLNTAILTTYGAFHYAPFSLEGARALLHEFSVSYASAIGHASTAEILTELLGVPVAVNRVEYAQGVGATALIFKLHGRPEEGKILNRQEIERIGYSLGLLQRID